jgi:exopolysaccharide production protein ExoZ
VIWCHIKYDLGPHPGNYPSLPFLATNLGSIGVDIFFVISGFVITMSAAKLGDDWRTFMALRIARIVPLYFAVSTYALVETVLSSHFSGKPMLYSKMSILETYTFIPFLDRDNFTGPILVNGWTLSFEMWFYLCFAGLLKLNSGRRAWIWLPGFFAAGMIANLAFFQYGHWYLPKFLFHPITLEFCAGCILYKTRNFIGKYGLYAMGGLSLFFLYIAFRTPSLGMHWTILDDPMAGLRRTMVWGGFATCLVGMIAQIDLKYSWAWPRFLLLLGDASYSIYLVPAAFMMTFEIGLKALGRIGGHELMPSPWWHGTVFVLGSVAIGIVSWKYFELPANSLARRFLFHFTPAKQEDQNAPAKIPA